MVDVFHSRDTEAVGFTKAYVRAQLKARRWQRRLRGVVITHNGTPTREQAEKETLLYADGNTPGVAYLSGINAAIKHGWPIAEQTIVTVTTTSRVPSVPGIVEVHRARRIRIRDVVVVDGVRVGSPIRTLVDLAPDYTERDLRYLVAKLVQQRKLSARYLEQELQRLVRWPGTHALREIVAAVTRGARSGGEIRLLNGLASRGWQLSPNQHVALREGGTREDDLVCDALRIVIQVESVAHHAMAPDVIADASRDMDYTRARYATIRAWTARIEADLPGLLDEIVATLEARAEELGVPLGVARGAPPGSSTASTA
jgi:hypothetical protein